MDNAEEAMAIRRFKLGEQAAEIFEMTIAIS